MIAAQTKAATVLQTPVTATGGAGLGDESQTRYQHTTRNAYSQSPNSQLVAAKLKAAADVLTGLQLQGFAVGTNGSGILLLWHMRQDGRCACGLPPGHPKCAPGKHPISRKEKDGKPGFQPHGEKDATADLGELRARLLKYPYANLALRLGPDIVAIDIDVRHGAYVEDLPISLEERQTWTQETGGGGWHLLYRLPTPPDGYRWQEGRLRNERGEEARGFDVKGGGYGYIVLTPSNHASGSRYKWAADLGPGEAFILETPPALAELLPRQRVGSAHTTTARTSDAASLAANPASADIQTKFSLACSEVFPDFDPSQNDQMVRCVFHPDDNASMHLVIDRGVFYCHGNGCIAHRGGGLYDSHSGKPGLARLALEAFGLVMPWDRKPHASAETPCKAAPATDVANMGEIAAPLPPEPAQIAAKTATKVAPPPRVLPWALTREDWASCDICGALCQHTKPAYGSDVWGGGSHYRKVCKRRDCQVSVKIRAANMLAWAVELPTVYTATVERAAWDKTTRRLKDAGAIPFGIPTATGEILAVTNLPDALPGAAPTDLEAVYAAFCAAPKWSRIRRPQATTREKLATFGEDQAVERAAVVACEPRERLKVVSAKMNATDAPPDEREALARKLRKTFPPDMEESRLRAAWERAGVEIAANGRSFTYTRESGYALVAELEALTRELQREGNTRIASIRANQTVRSNSGYTPEEASAPPMNGGKSDSHTRFEDLTGWK